MPNNNHILTLARQIGDELEHRYPTVTIDNAPAIPYDSVDALADDLALVLAEILQSWLDAGSERDVTLEELTDPIRQHLLGWTGKE